MFESIVSLNLQITKMSVIGIDFGNEAAVIAVARHKGIDVILNESSKRFTP